MAKRLGAQTITVIEQVRGQSNTRTDGASSVQPGCVVQVISQPGEVLADGRARETLEWALYAPAGFRASRAAVCTVQPGPMDDDGEPLRLAFAGTPQPVWDLRGRETYVYAVLRVSS